MTLWKEKWCCRWDGHEGTKEERNGKKFGSRNVVGVGFWSGLGIATEGRAGEARGRVLGDTE